MAGRGGSRRAERSDAREPERVTDGGFAAHIDQDLRGSLQVAAGRDAGWLRRFAFAAERAELGETVETPNVLALAPGAVEPLLQFLAELNEAPSLLPLENEDVSV